MEIPTMRNTIFPIFLTCVIMLTVKGLSAENSTDSLLVARIIDGQPVIVTEANLEAAIESALGDGTNITEVIVEQSVDYYYLIGNGVKNDTVSVNVGIELFHNKDELWLKPQKESHNCRGNPCQCCQFLKDGQGKIYGCNCKDGFLCSGLGNAWCDHSISTQFSGEVLNYL